ncbi:unnamed protein product [Boreogadus saida]
MVRSRAHPNQWDVGLILPPTKKSALECLSKWNIPPSKWNLLLTNWRVFDLTPLDQVGASTVQFSGATHLEPYLAHFRLAEGHNGWGAGKAVVHLALALEGTAVQALLDLAPADQRDLGGLTRALERRFGQRAVGSHSRELLTRRRRQEGERFGAYAADVQLDWPRHGWGSTSASSCPRPPTWRALDVALHVAEQAERELSDQPSLQEDDCQDQSGPAKHCCRRCGARMDAAGAVLSRGTTTVASQSGHDEERVRKPRPPDLEPEQCRRVKDCGWNGQRPPHPNRRHGRRRGGGRRMGSPNGPPAPPYGRNWGQGDGAGPLNTRDCALGVGVVGTSDP